MSNDSIQVQSGNVWDGLSRLLAAHPDSSVRVTTVEISPTKNGNGKAPHPAAPIVATPRNAKLGIRWNVQGHAVVALLANDILQNDSPATFKVLAKLMSSDPDRRGDVPDLEPVGAYAQWPD